MLPRECQNMQDVFCHYMTKQFQASLSDDKHKCRFFFTFSLHLRRRLQILSMVIFMISAASGIVTYIKKLSHVQCHTGEN